MAIEKLRGFVADHEATIVKINGNQIQLELVEHSDGRLRRLTDRPVAFQIDLRFEEQRAKRESDGKPRVRVGGVLRTRIFVRLSPRRARDRRRGDAASGHSRSDQPAVVSDGDDGGAGRPRPKARW